MAHKPININRVSLSFPHKVCFDEFSAQIQPGDRIAIIGNNGSGKTSLLKILLGDQDSTTGKITNLESATIGYVPQVITGYNELSGGQRFNKEFTNAVTTDPDILILDEPTNHLDNANKNSLMNMLNKFGGTLIIVSHDTDLLNKCINKIWHIKDGKINIFSGNYRDYMAEQNLQYASQEHTLNELKKQKKQLKIEKQKEQQKLDKKRVIKDNNKMAFDGKADKNQAKTGGKIAKLRSLIADVESEISINRLSDYPNPNFILTAGYASRQSNLISISNGWCGYSKNTPIVSNIYFSLDAQDKIVINGNNGSGKTTFLRTLMNDTNIMRGGDWHLLKKQDIGYIEQHYANLDFSATAFQIIKNKNPSLTDTEIRKHLNSFLFRKNEEVFCCISNLSGGEKLRLSLAQIAAMTPKLLVLDEITNNLDIETKNYLAYVLSRYPGAFILISHEKEFINKLPITAQYVIKNGIFSNQR